MGEHNVSQEAHPADLRAFTHHLMQDVRALNRMLEEDRFEKGIRRIGAEQELFLVDKQGEPAPINEQVLNRNTDERIVPELTKFNLEFNMDPLVYGGDCFRQMEAASHELMTEVRRLVDQENGDVCMVGILPTAHLSDFTLDYMTDRPRYFALNDAISRLRGGPGQYQIRGIDELFVKHDSIMLEGCNTSFQTHFQVTPEEFPRFYNIAQTVAAPCLSAATNSPLLFGKRLWRETRVALFQQAVDTRSSNLYLREMSPRVHFGSCWVENSVMEIFKEDIARFRVLLTTEFDEDPLEVLDDGGVPKLKALQLHNGTVYRWNRACYGITDGEPHLRIENRILPSGPTVIDEIANAVFWYGLVGGIAEKYDDVADRVDFDEVRHNFINAARNGLSAQFVWLDGKKYPAPSLILDRLLPLAKDGLHSAGVDADDVDKYLEIIQDRVTSGQTGAEWQLKSVAGMNMKGSRAERLGALTRSMVDLQKEGEPVHTWPMATLDKVYAPTSMQSTNAEDFMSTDLFTVHEEESVEFVAHLMDWRRIRHILVEDEQHRLVGLVSHRALLRFMAEKKSDVAGETPVRDIMVQDPISIPPEMRTIEAVQVMRSEGVGALPVVREGQLVGIITERDFIEIAGNLLDESLGETPDTEEILDKLRDEVDDETNGRDE